MKKTGAGITDCLCYFPDRQVRISQQEFHFVDAHLLDVFGDSTIEMRFKTAP